MAIPGPGIAISMTTIATEFGGTVPHSLSEYYRGGGLVPNVPANAAIPTSGQIAIGNFYGATNRISVPLTLAGNAYNYNVYANRGPAYVAGISDVVVTVNPGVTIGSTSTGAYAMLVPSAFNPGDTITIVNGGVIQGMGGAGGNGAYPTFASAGAGGGNAVYVNRPTIITNNGTLAGGGGGGGGGGASSTLRYKAPNSFGGGGGGGGGAGFNGGAAGAGGSNIGGVSGTPGGAGTSTTGGGGGGGGSTPDKSAGPGGAGGGRGANGAAGSASSGIATPFQPGAGGGGTGNYIVGNPFVTYPATGTRQGGVA